MEKTEPLYTVGGNVSWCSHYGKKLKIELPYDPVFSSWVYILKKTKTLIQKDTCTPMFIAALFTIVKIWKQTKRPSTDEWIKTMWSIHTMIY